MILIVPYGATRHGEAQTLIRRYFQERFREGEQVEVFFIGCRRCYLRVVKVHAATTEDGHPTSRYEVHQEQWDIEPGVCTDVGPGVPV